MSRRIQEGSKPFARIEQKKSGENNPVYNVMSTVFVSLKYFILFVMFIKRFINSLNKKRYLIFCLFRIVYIFKITIDNVIISFCGNV